MTDFTIGVEEEFHLVDADTGRLRPAVAGVLRQLPDDANIEPELLRTQVETGTPVCSTLAELRTELIGTRRKLVAAAARVGCRIAASGTWPDTAPDVEATEKPRYEAIVDTFGPTAREATVCGCHVHVGVADPELAIAVIRRSRPWLPVLLALSTNSPFWRGADTGYASYRSQVWSRWPTAGPPPALRSRREYDDLVAALLRTGVMRDTGMLYWDIRASTKYPTAEFRVADVCLSVDEAVLLAGLTRGLVRTALEAELAGHPDDQLRPELLRVASWRAARSGLDRDLIDPLTDSPVPAAQVVGRLLNHVRPALDAEGDAEVIATLAGDVLERGTGARRQRIAHARRGRISDVIDLLVSAPEAAN